MASQAGRIAKLTGLVPDPYFSATKLEWLLARTEARSDELAFGTVDSWLVWKLTDGRVHATDLTNASRTMLLDLETLAAVAECKIPDPTALVPGYSPALWDILKKALAKNRNDRFATAKDMADALDGFSRSLTSSSWTGTGWDNHIVRL